MTKSGLTPLFQRFYELVLQSKTGLNNHSFISLVKDFKLAIDANNMSNSETKYMLNNKMLARPICYVCGINVLPFRGQTLGYQRTCSIKCSRQLDSFKDSLKNPDTIAKRQKSLAATLESRGVTNVGQLQSTKNKIKQTVLERYGTKSILQSEVVQAKIRQTNLKKYGAVNVLSAGSSIREQINNKNEIRKEHTKNANSDKKKKRCNEIIC